MATKKKRTPAKKRASRKPTAKRKPSRKAKKPGKLASFSAAAKKFLKKKVRLLIREGRKAKQAVAMAFSFARKRGYKVPPKTNPLTRKEARELLAYALYSASQAKKLNRKGLSKKQRQLREARASGRASAVADYAGEGAAVERKRARKVEAKLAKRSGIGALSLRPKKTNPAQMLGVTTFINPTLQDAAESWAKARGLKVPARGSAAHAGLFNAWQRAGMPVRNPAKKSKKAWACACFSHATGIPKAGAKCRTCGDPARLVVVCAERGELPYCSFEHSKKARENPRRGRKPKKTAKARKPKRKVSTVTKTVTTRTKTVTNPTKSVKRIKRYGDLPAPWKARLRGAAIKAARRDRCRLEDVPIAWGKSDAPAPRGLLDHGELVAFEYELDGRTPKGSRFRGPRFRHASGDHGRGKKRTRRERVGVDPKTKRWRPVSVRGSRPGFSTERGFTG